MQPIAKFVKSINGLSVQFTDSSTGVPTQWEWNFGDGNTDTSKNPSHTYPTAGIYNIVLTAYNSDGYDTIVSQVMVGQADSLNQTIAQMVLCNAPEGIWVDTECFENTKKHWMLYLQPLVEPEILDVDVFDETKWPALVKVLLSKLIIKEQITAAIKNTVLAFNQQKTIINNPVLSQVSDWQTNVNPNLLVIPGIYLIEIIINGVTYSSGELDNGTTSFIDYLNSLNKGIFGYDVYGTLMTYANKFQVTSIKVGPVGGPLVNHTFTQLNKTIVSSDPTMSVEEIQKTSMGSIKYIETGPSKVEWYDRSDMWANLFKKSGAMEDLEREICSWGSRLRIKLPGCTFSTSTPLFKKGANPSGSCGEDTQDGLYLNNF